MTKPISKSYLLPFPVRQVYRAWVSSDTVVPPATSMDIDPKVGGHYRQIMDTTEFKARNEGTFSRVVPNERLTYSWEWNRNGEVTEIDVSFAGHLEGTSLQLTHSGFVKEQSRAMHDSGWDRYIEGLSKYLSAG